MKNCNYDLKNALETIHIFDKYKINYFNFKMSKIFSNIVREERAYSVFKRVEFYTRSTINEQKLNALSVLHIETDLVKKKSKFQRYSPKSNEKNVFYIIIIIINVRIE